MIGEERGLLQAVAKGVSLNLLDLIARTRDVEQTSKSNFTTH
jgi:hypothetical protein